MPLFKAQTGGASPIDTSKVVSLLNVATVNTLDANPLLYICPAGKKCRVTEFVTLSPTVAIEDPGDDGLLFGSAWEAKALPSDPVSPQPLQANKLISKHISDEFALPLGLAGEELRFNQSGFVTDADYKVEVWGVLYDA